MFVRGIHHILTAELDRRSNTQVQTKLIVIEKMSIRIREEVLSDGFINMGRYTPDYPLTYPTLSASTGAAVAYLNGTLRIAY